MIADQTQHIRINGHLSPGIHSAGTFRQRVLQFIETKLPCWRDDADRPATASEDRLNDSLCEYLNWAARQHLDVIVFVREPPQSPSRNCDLGVKPATAMAIEGIRQTIYDELLPIECKILPTPVDPKRSDLEYVHGRGSKRSGGIERFKHRLHGPCHGAALLIGYILDNSFDHWFTTVNQRLEYLASTHFENDLWCPAELLNEDSSLVPNDVKRCKSEHRRIAHTDDNRPIVLEHLWIRMKSISTISTSETLQNAET